MRIFCAAAILALLAGPALAQQKPVPRYGDLGEAKSPQEIEAEKATDKAYKRSLNNIPDQGPIDPWGNARSTDAPKSAAKTGPKSAAKTSPAKTTKTGNAAN
jgi:hypothetical protein